MKSQMGPRGKGNQGEKGSMCGGKLPQPWIPKGTMPWNLIQHHGHSHARLIISVWLYLTPIFLISLKLM